MTFCSSLRNASSVSPPVIPRHRLLVGAVDLDRVPPVLHAVLDHALR